MKRGPVNEYISACCSLPAEKPACGSVLATQTEGKKVTKVTRGLGTWHCSGCKKASKVTARKPQPKDAVTEAAEILQNSLVEVPVAG